MKEAIAWLSYTYLYVRMMQNPLPYGITWQELTADPRLDARRCGVEQAAEYAVQELHSDRCWAN